MGYRFHEPEYDEQNNLWLIGVDYHELPGCFAFGKKMRSYSRTYCTEDTAGVGWVWRDAVTGHRPNDPVFEGQLQEHLAAYKFRQERQK